MPRDAARVVVAPAPGVGVVALEAVGTTASSATTTPPGRSIAASARSVATGSGR